MIYDLGRERTICEQSERQDFLNIKDCLFMGVGSILVNFMENDRRFTGPSVDC